MHTILAIAVKSERVLLYLEWLKEGTLYVVGKAKPDRRPPKGAAQGMARKHNIADDMILMFACFTACQDVTSRKSMQSTVH